MSKFFETIREKVKRIPDLIAKRLVHVSILEDSLEFRLPPIKKKSTIKQYLEDLIIKVNDFVAYDASTYPFDFEVKLNKNLYTNKEILEIYDKSLKIGDKLGLIVPNRPNISTGFHNVIIETHSEGVKANFKKYFSIAPENAQLTTSQVIVNIECKNCGKHSSDPNQVICEYCGSLLKE